MNKRAWCDGVTRRDLLHYGTAGIGSCGVTLPTLLAADEANAARGLATSDKKSLIIVFLQGGLSTIDTWDMKPEAPAEFRGPFQPIGTNLKIGRAHV